MSSCRFWGGKVLTRKAVDERPSWRQTFDVPPKIVGFVIAFVLSSQPVSGGIPDGSLPKEWHDIRDVALAEKKAGP